MPALPFLQAVEVKDTLHAYQLSKRGNVLRMMAEAVRRGKLGVRINSVSPGIRQVELIAEGFDLAVRNGALGNGTSLHARRLVSLV